MGAERHPGRDGPGAGGRIRQFRIASITKIFVAVVALQLAEEGRLSLDEPRPAIVPTRPLRPRDHPPTAQPHQRHPRLLPYRPTGQAACRQPRPPLDERPTWSPCIETTSRVPARHRLPYSNTNYVLLGEVITPSPDTAGLKQIRDRILDPLHLDHTYVAGFEPVRRPVLPGYFDLDATATVDNVETGEPGRRWKPRKVPRAHRVQRRDLLTFGDALFHGRLLQRRLCQPWWPRGRSIRATELRARAGDRAARLPDPIWGHGGFLPGFNRFWYVPSRDAVSSSSPTHPAPTRPTSPN